MADTAREMRRYEVPVDGQPHTINAPWPVKVAVIVGDEQDVVEFWAFFGPLTPGSPLTFQVFGTGQAIPENAVYVGTADRTDEGLVWHLFNVTPEVTGV